MKVNERQHQARKTISKIESAIFEAIDQSSTDEATYAEINAALLRVITTLNGEQLKGLWDNNQTT